MGKRIQILKQAWFNSTINMLYGPPQMIRNPVIYQIVRLYAKSKGIPEEDIAPV